MAPVTPPPETETPIFDFIPGDLEPIDIKSKEPSSKFKLPDALTQSWLKHAFRPILFGALGIHAFLLFVPLTSVTQAKPKELAEPVKLKRLSDKVLVKSMPKVKVTSASKKTSLPKVAVASSNPIVVKDPDFKPDDKKADDKKTEDKKTDDKKTDSKDSKVADGKTNDKGVDPSTVAKDKATTNKDEASQLDEGTQKFSPIIVGLNKSFNPTEELAPVPEAEQLNDPAPFFKVTPPPITGAVISNQEVDTVIDGLKTSFPDKFAAKGTYGGVTLYEAKVGEVTRYISVVKADNVIGKNVLVFLWEKPPA